MIEAMQLTHFMPMKWVNSRQRHTEMHGISSYSDQMTENAEQNNFEYGHLLRSGNHK